jgi:hypothetical protein
VISANPIRKYSERFLDSHLDVAVWGGDERHRDASRRMYESGPPPQDQQDMP